MSEQLPSGGIELSPDEIEALHTRWSSCWTPSEVARQLAGIDTPWYVAAGWALDLFLGRQTRAHGDLEIAIPAATFPEVRNRFPGFVFDAAGSGRIWEDAAPEVLAAVHQTWLRDPATGNYLLDVFREPHDGDTWICRRDGTIRLPYGDIVHHTADGIPYLAPELVLLFKAKHVRPKDQTDFDATVPHLTPAQRATLSGLLARVHPGHPWISDLSPAPSDPPDALMP
ncbi:nucleotidyltransferase domain-containing protein [Kitasatospora sp. NPDC059599]|uniref:nucleotidyltransferase domain-containing protein n=1 Tax=Kitasatospora sp. NPDC059599 TaxID=3346880 RepID=UPI0036A9BFB0